jgi:hypothetical protein
MWRVGGLELRFEKVLNCVDQAGDIGLGGFGGQRPAEGAECLASDGTDGDGCNARQRETDSGGAGGFGEMFGA